MPFYRTAELGVIHIRGRKFPPPCGEQLLLDGKTVPCMAPTGFFLRWTGPGPPHM
jgi:hypothetical protein